MRENGECRVTSVEGRTPVSLLCVLCPFVFHSTPDPRHSSPVSRAYNPPTNLKSTIGRLASQSSRRLGLLSRRACLFNSFTFVLCYSVREVKVFKSERVKSSVSAA